MQGSGTSHIRTRAETNSFAHSRLIWGGSLAACTALTVLAFLYFDLPVAKAFSANLGRFEMLEESLGTTVLLSIEAAIVLCFSAVRLVRGPGKMSSLSKTLALASVTSTFVYAANDGVLKILLGVPDPQYVFILGMQHSFHFFAGSRDSSFPSGHMIMAGAFAGVFMHLYPKSSWPFAILLAIAVVALIVGDWHFLSDVIAGTFVGVSCGILAGKLLRHHVNPGG